MKQCSIFIPLWFRIRQSGPQQTEKAFSELTRNNVFLFQNKFKSHIPFQVEYFMVPKGKKITDKCLFFFIAKELLSVVLNSPSMTPHPNNISVYLSGAAAQLRTPKPKGIHVSITQVTTGVGSHRSTPLGFPLLPMPWHTKLQMLLALASGWMSTELLTWCGLQW